MNYRDYNDNELLSYISENNEDANEIIFRKYDPLIRSISNRMYKYCKNSGLEIGDLIQEGMVGLNLAINNFDDQKNISFFSFARTCIERRIISIVVGSRRQKHQILNDSLSLELPDEEKYKLDILLSDKSLNPENLVISREQNDTMLHKIKKSLTDFELQVFELKISGFSYKEISNILDKDSKAIDNAVQRLRTKVKIIIHELEI